MSKSVRMNTYSKRHLLLLAVVIISLSSFGQSDSLVSIPELVFRNPVLISGIAGKQGATYKFSKVATGIDAVIRLKTFSDPAIIVKNIDNNTTGYDKAFQPEFGMDPVKRNQDWYIDFELTFYTTGTNNKLMIDKFVATSLDVDGDGSNVREYVVMDKATSVSYSNNSYLTGGVTAVPTCGLCGRQSNPVICTSCQGSGIIVSGGKNKKCNKCNGVGKVYSACSHPFDGQDIMEKGPIDNFANIDTISSGVMASYVYNNKDVVNFRIGAQSGNKDGGAGIRMNSIWFKGFNLSIGSPLPVKLTSFTATLVNEDPVLNWTAAEENFSHYIVQRSNDGKSFQDVAVEFGDAHNYIYKDANALSATGMLFYRLQMVDKTGEFIYSEVKAIQFRKEAEALKLYAYPNPVADQVRVSLPSAWQGKAITIALYSNSGVLVRNSQISHASQTESIQLNTIAKGFYIIKASCNGEVARQQILKN